MVALATVGLVAAAPVAANECACQDVPDIRNRLCEARAAVAEYNRLSDRVRREEERSGKSFPYSGEAKEQIIKPCVQEAINTVYTPGSKSASAETSDDTCEIEFKRADSACIRKAVERHEMRHAAICRWRQEKREELGFFRELVARLGDPRAGQTLVGYLNEERSAYQTEINHLRSELMRLSNECPRQMFMRQQGNRMVFSIEFCPQPKPRPAKQDSQCGERD